MTGGEDGEALGLSHIVKDLPHGVAVYRYRPEDESFELYTPPARACAQTSSNEAFAGAFDAGSSSGRIGPRTVAPPTSVERRCSC
ncbi:MAG: hypothetical protein AAFZ18_23275 [Myxococcota bacterium]